MIQTNVFVSQRKGVILDIDPKVITNPKGNAHTSVIPNIFNVV